MVRRADSDHERRNAEAARIIASNPDRYGGPDSLMARWAALVLDKSEAGRQHIGERGQLVLFPVSGCEQQRGGLK